MNTLRALFLNALMLGLLGLCSTMAQAQSEQWNDADITPDTVVHRAGQQSPLQIAGRPPFEADSLTGVFQIPPTPIQAELTDFTLCQTTGQEHEEWQQINWRPSI